MYKRNKFEGIKTIPLLKFVQDEAVKIYGGSKKKSTRTRTFLNRLKTLNKAREELMLRLDTMDRNKAEFFPPGSLIDYKEAEGRVVNNEGGKTGTEVHVKMDTDDFFIAVSASELILTHIKIT